jgi:hypothetical protein
VASAADGVDPEAKAIAVGEGGDGVVQLAIIGGQAGTISPGHRVPFPQGWRDGDSKLMRNGSHDPPPNGTRSDPTGCHLAGIHSA